VPHFWFFLRKFSGLTRPRSSLVCCQHISISDEPTGPVPRRFSIFLVCCCFAPLTRGHDPLSVSLGASVFERRNPPFFFPPTVLRHLVDCSLQHSRFPSDFFAFVTELVSVVAWSIFPHECRMRRYSRAISSVSPVDPPALKSVSPTGSPFCKRSSKFALFPVWICLNDLTPLS